MRTYFLWFTLLAIAALFCGQTSSSTQKRKQPGQDAEARQLVEQATAFLEAELADSAQFYARQAVQLAATSGDWYAWSQAQIHLITAGYYLGEYRETAGLFPKLETTARAHIHADSSFWGDYFNIAGAMYNALGNYEAAIEFGLREIAFFTKNNKHTDLAIASNNVGTYYRNKGDYDRALEYTQAALQHFKLAPETPAEDFAWTYTNLSKTWYRKKDFPKAIEYAQQTLAMLDRQPPDLVVNVYINAYNDLAIAYTEIQEYEKALGYLKRALEQYEKTDLDGDKGSTLQNLGYVYRMMGRYAEAKTFLNQAIELYGPQHPNYGKACRHLGYVAQREGDLQGALQWQQKSLLALTDSFPYQDVLANPAPQRVNAYLDFLFALRDKAETLSLIADKEVRPDYLDAALATLDLAAGLLDSMRTEYQEGSRQFWNQEARPLMESAIALALRQYRFTGQQHYLEQAFRYAERSKALLLAEALHESAAKQQAGIPEALLQEEKQLKIDISFYKSRIFREQQRNKPNADKILLWQTQIHKSRRAYEELLDKLEKSYPEYYRIKYKQPELSLAAVQKKLPKKTGLLEFFTGDKGIYAFYIDRDGAKGFTFQPDSIFNQTLDTLLLTLHDRNRALEEGRSAAAFSRFAKNAASLYQALLAPIVPGLPEQLLLIPDGKLAYLPFELLLTGDAPNSGTPDYAALPYVLRQTTVRYEYAAALAFDRPARSKSSGQFAGFAPGYAGDWAALATRGADIIKCAGADPADFAPLQNNQAEVTQIAQMFDGQAFLGDAATEMQFRQQAGAPKVIHLAMHGFLNDCDPLYSGLVFSKVLPRAQQDTVSTETDGVLYTYEIYNLRLNAALAVLSACNTGRGKLAKGEGVISLARAFKYAGCANVLMSLWQADDQATAQLMQDFYRYLQQGMGKDAAIRQAKLDYLDNNARNHPFFWGAFVLIGDDQPLDAGIAWWWYALGVVGLGLGIGGWRWFAARTRPTA